MSMMMLLSADITLRGASRGQKLCPRPRVTHHRPRLHRQAPRGPNAEEDCAPRDPEILVDLPLESFQVRAGLINGIQPPIPTLCPS
jgi:hypothetical protein